MNNKYWLWKQPFRATVDWKCTKTNSNTCLQCLFLFFFSDNRTRSRTRSSFRNYSKTETYGTSHIRWSWCTQWSVQLWTLWLQWNYAKFIGHTLVIKLSDLFIHKTCKACDEFVIQCLFVRQDCMRICCLICFFGERKPEIPEKNTWSKDSDEPHRWEVGFLATVPPLFPISVSMLLCMC